MWRELTSTLGLCVKLAIYPDYNWTNSGITYSLTIGGGGEGTYPAKIEVMQTAEPTAIPASSPTCTNSDDAQPQKTMDKIDI